MIRARPFDRGCTRVSFERLVPKKKWNRKGAIEGLPLQLIIMVVIAGVALVIIMAWLAPWKNKVDLASVNASPSNITKGYTTGVTLTAWDTKDNKLSGVTVVLDGCTCHTSGTTNSTGAVKFSLKPDLPPGTTTGQITVTATYSGTMTIEKTTIIIVT
jgi:hypothetical protein